MFTDWVLCLRVTVSPGKYECFVSGILAVHSGLRVFGQHSYDCHLCLAHHGAPAIFLSFSLLPLCSSNVTIISDNLPQLLTHKDAHIFPRFEDHQRYSIVVATTSVLLSLYSTYIPKRIPLCILYFILQAFGSLFLSPWQYLLGLPLHSKALRSSMPACLDGPRTWWCSFLFFQIMRCCHSNPPP